MRSRRPHHVPKKKRKDYQPYWLRITGMVAVAIGFGTMLLMSFCLITSEDLPLELAIKKAVGKGEDYCGSTVINDTRGVGYIRSDCTPINEITKGIQRCEGCYYVFADKIYGKWIVEKEKHIIW